MTCIWIKYVTLLETKDFGEFESKACCVTESPCGVSYLLSLTILFLTLTTNFPGCILVVLNMIEERILGSHLHCLSLHFIWKIHQLQSSFPVRRSHMLHRMKYILSVGRDFQLPWAVPVKSYQGWFSEYLVLARSGLCLLLVSKYCVHV